MEKDTKDTKDYEIGFLAEDEAGVPAVTATLTKHGAEILLEGPAERVTLAYPIAHRTAAVFAYVHFRATPDIVSGVTKALAMQGGILRTLLITPPFEKQKPRWEGRPRRSAPVAAAPSVTAAPSSLPLSNEALEKKIEEILK